MTKCGDCVFAMINRTGRLTAKRSMLSRSRTASVLCTLVLVLSAIYSPTTRAAESRRQLLVYYANETTEETARSDNYETLFRILRTSQNPMGNELADIIASDVRKFRAIVERDVQTLLASAPRIGFDVAIFTNTHTLNGQYLYYSHTAGTADTRRFPALQPPPNAILATSPLARSDALHVALTEVASLYSTGQLDLTLIANSHGTDDMALIPRVNTDLSTPSGVEGFAQQLNSGSDVEAPFWAVLQGTSKVEFWRTLSQVAAKHEVTFPLIFRQACESGLHSWEEYRAVPQNVGRVAHSSTEPMKIVQVDYPAIFAGIAPGSDWVQQLSNELIRSGVNVEARGQLWMRVVSMSIRSLHPLYYFMPLVLWLTWFGFQVARTRRTLSLDQK